MYRYHTDKRIDINGRNYNVGEIIVSETPIEGLKDISAPITMISEIPKEQLAKIKPRIEKPRSYGIKGKIADIIIPHHNRHDLLKNTLDAIPLDIFNIFIIAGGSFARNCNLGARLAKTDNLIFMNDDIDPDIDQLIESCNNNADLVGFSEVLPNQNNRMVKGIGWSRNLASNLMSDQRDVHIPSGFLFRAKKDAWKKLGGFDETFLNGAEDCDLGLRAVEMGMSIDYIIGDPIIHYHSQSEGRFDKVLDNKVYFQKLWPEERLKKVLGYDKPIKRVLLANQFLKNLAGTETFIYTFGKELERRGYKVDVFTFEPGQLSDQFFTITPKSKNKLRKEYDYIFINHNTCLDYLKDVRGVKIFTSHGIYLKLEQAKEGADFYVGISQEVRDHLIDNGFDTEVIHNGIDCERFKPRKPIHKKLKRVLSICKDLDENFNDANNVIEEACNKLGIEFMKARDVWDLENKMNEVDLVVSLGRGAYEAMACGRAVLVFDKRHYMKESKGDGIVTKDNIDEILKNNFSGRRYNIKFDIDSLVNELQKYDQSMGDFNREYALEHFNIKKQVDKYFELADMNRNDRVMFVGSSTTEYGIAKQLEKQLKQNRIKIGYGGKKICYANDLGTIDPTDGSLIILENRPTFKRAMESGADHIFYSQKSCAEYFNSSNSSYLPSAIDKDIFKDIGLERKTDIGFVGKEAYTSRVKFIKFLKDKYGDGFEKQEGIFFDEMAEFYNKCKIVVNQSPGNDINMRMFEATACGSLLITQEVPYLDELFEIGKEIVVYSTMRELTEKIDYYLEHDKEREKIARAGQRRTLRDHTYKNRVKDIIKIIK